MSLQSFRSLRLRSELQLLKSNVIGDARRRALGADGDRGAALSHRLRQRGQSAARAHR